jgi:tetratricopeptide (TPR) repeat protein
VPEFHINFLLRAAQGWIELGLPHEAWAELQQVPAEAQHRLEVMLLSLDTLQTLKQWKECATLGEEAARRYPDCGAIYLVTAYAIRRSRSLAEAREFLLQATDALAEEAMFHFNLACYACQLGDMDETMHRLETAFRLDPKYRAQALDDEDLRPMWDRLKADNFKA